MIISEREQARTALVVILLLALVLRLRHIDFGLPSMYDPDEPMFMLKSVEMLSQHSLNPHWFGHPGSTTLYLVALIDAAVIVIGRLSGSWNSIAEFTRAVYADPGLLFIPARTMMAVLGVASVGLTYVVGRQLFGRATGLIAAGLLCLNALHVAWSQVVRTDIHASVFMLVSLVFAVRVAKTGRTRDYMLAGLLTGFAIATKWPAASIFSAVIGAAIARALMPGSNARAEAWKLAGSALAALIGLFVASPFLFFDWPTVLSDLSGEARPFHLGHTGAGFFYNLLWYFRAQVAGSMGWLGLGFVAVGVVVAARSSIAARVTLLPAAAAFLVMISAQNLIWSRWILPILPILCIFAAVAIETCARRVAGAGGGVRAKMIFALIIALAFIPSVAGEVDQARERATDTRALAAQWAIAHVPPGSTIVLEHLELRLKEQPWTILFPIGERGCVDGPKMLRTGVRYDDVSRLRNGSPIVDLGNVSPARLATCQADYAILVYFDLYRVETMRFPRQNAVYSRLLAGGQTVALFRPAPGKIGGPVTRIVRLQHR